MFIALLPYLVKLVTFDIILVLLISLCKVTTQLKVKMWWKLGKFNKFVRKSFGMIFAQYRSPTSTSTIKNVRAVG